MPARLFSQTGKTRGFELRFEDEAVIGRDPQNNLVIDQPLMSSRHARIAYHEDDGRFVLEDLESLNGTELDGDPVTGQERLGHLHVITFADTYDFFFQDLERCARRHPTAAAPKDAPAGAAIAQADPSSKSPTNEITSIDKEPIALPGFLARRADAVREQNAGPEAAQRGVGEITSIEKEPAALPAVLGQRADEARASAAESTQPERQPDITMHEKLPVILPGLIARRADAAHKATLDLSDIEELLSADADADPNVKAEDASSGEEPSGLHLVVTESNGRVRRIDLVQGENLIGRSSSVQVSMAYPDLSRHHAVLTVEAERITLRDLGSRNRTFLDDQPLDAEVETAVQIGARLRFGSIEARLVGES